MTGPSQAVTALHLCKLIHKLSKLFIVEEVCFRWIKCYVFYETSIVQNFSWCKFCCNDCFAQTYSFKKKLERKEVSSQFHTYKNRDSATFKLV